MDISIVVGGYLWLGESARAIGPVTLEMLDSARKEILLTAYLINNKDIIEKIHNALARGVRVRVIINSPENQQFKGAIQQLRMLENSYPNMKISGFNEAVMHAKVLVVDRKDALISSANLTVSGMTNNYEMGFLVKDEEIANQVEGILLRIWG